MIVAEIKMWPLGDPDPSTHYSLGTVVIINTGDGTPALGNYDAYVCKCAEGLLLRGNAEVSYILTRMDERGAWKKGRIENFPKIRLGPHDLLYRVLKSVVGWRNR